MSKSKGLMAMFRLPNPKPYEPLQPLTPEPLYLDVSTKYSLTKIQTPGACQLLQLQAALRAEILPVSSYLGFRV